MSKSKKEDGFSNLGIKKLILRAGAERVGEDGIQRMKEFLESVVDEVSTTAVKITHKNDDRRVTKKELELAFDIYKGKL